MIIITNYRRSVTQTMTALDRRYMVHDIKPELAPVKNKPYYRQFEKRSKSDYVRESPHRGK